MHSKTMNDRYERSNPEPHSYHGGGVVNGPGWETIKGNLLEVQNISYQMAKSRDAVVNGM